MQLLKKLMVLLRLRLPEATVTYESSSESRLERFSREYEFYKNRGGYRQHPVGDYTIASAKKVTIVTFSSNIAALIAAVAAIEKSLADRSSPNRKALRVVADSIAPQQPRRLVDYLMAGDFYVYPDGTMGEILSNSFSSLLKTMEELEVSEREGRYAFYIRFVDPLLEDCLALFKVLNESYN